MDIPVFRISYGNISIFEYMKLENNRCKGAMEIIVELEFLQLTLSLKHAWITLYGMIVLWGCCTSNSSNSYYSSLKRSCPKGIFFCYLHYKFFLEKCLL